ncbi:MAG TPA: DUF4382 domain-containing protein [Longimicrobium sp.]|nr:DUF4382 domain-containing protein [Longimicrobium sp.]
MFKHTRFLLPLLAAAALGACDGGTDSGSSRVSIRLVDAPGDFKEVKVQITELYLQGGAESDSTSGRLTLATDTTTYFDLLTLVGGAGADLVKDAVIPAGTYSQLRVRVGDAYVVTRDGKVYATQGARLPAGMTATGTINLTSGKSRASGYKIRFPGSGLTVDGDSRIVALDFDVARSFGHVAGRSGQIILNPQFTVSQVQLSGGISGLVTPAAGVAFPACGGAATDVTHFTATATGPTTLSARAQADSRYKMAYVSPGTYAMGVAPVGYANGDSLMIAATPSVPNLTLASGQNAVVDYSVTGITCKVKPA